MFHYFSSKIGVKWVLGSFRPLRSLRHKGFAHFHASRSTAAEMLQPLSYQLPIEAVYHLIFEGKYMEIPDDSLKTAAKRVRSCA